MSNAYERGRAAGYAEAVERERHGDATVEDNDPTTWFVTPAPGDPSDADLPEYERGWNAGWAEFFAGRES
ncbi:hypothetical protein [Rhodococcus pyridinivorans]|uniref:hypothetical protein n=1 Tax=Rhodococcus pyridinivorans TaxID=103816 RepID=UPI00265A4E6E|nr:hypothetical protein [Rhodococcus pyridinivorans]